MEEILKQNKNNIEKKGSYEPFEKLLSEDLKSRRLKEQSIVKGTISGMSKKYIYIDINAKSEAALEKSEFMASNELESIKIGDTKEFFLEKLDDKSGSVIISYAKAKRMRAWETLKNSYEKNEVVTGKILSKVKGGLACSVKGVLAFLPSSQIDLKPIKNINAFLNTEHKFSIVRMDPKRMNVVISRRQIIESEKNKDREKYMKNIKEGMILKSCIAKSIQPWGVFFSYGSLDLLCHINEISWSRVTSPGDLIQVGQTEDVFVYKIEGGRISGSLKRKVPDPFIEFSKKFKVGQKIEDCPIVSIKDYGVFCEIAPGLTGLCHSSEIDHLNPKIHPSKNLSVSQRIPIKILSIDEATRKVSLSYKDCFESPWNAFERDYKKGQVVKTKIKNKNDYAIYAYIESTQIVGMLHSSNLNYDSRKAQEDLEKLHKNSELTCQIYEIDIPNKKVQLTLKHMLGPDPYDWFKTKAVGSIITVTIGSMSREGLYVYTGAKKDIKILIKRNQLGKDGNQVQASRFIKGDSLDVIITELEIGNKTPNKISLSVKKLVERDEAEALKKWGSRDSGGKLAELLGPLLKDKKPKKDNKSKKEK